MNSQQNPFLRRVHASEQHTPLGSWLMAASPVISEAMAVAGFEFLVVDMEHAPMDIPDMVAVLHALSGTPAHPVVRLPWNDMVTVKRTLDAGAQTLMFPFVQNAAEARQAVSFTRYPPHGVRGVAAMHRGSRFGTKANYLQTAHDDLAVIIQLETPQALQQLEEIAQVPGVDAIFIGPGDLSATMGYPGNIAAEPVQAALKDAARRCRAIGKPCGIVGANADMVRNYADWGYNFVAIASDLAMLMREASQAATALNGKQFTDNNTGPY
ncbi:HpcH/HpaI aldolase/citrate lyase family protein [Neisseriaceae bacterium TC5R-5]|nr:HpcH/HpaI aldolase/citrate lyase family protein [Neisseriaceae bacterium TC5R-5]